MSGLPKPSAKFAAEVQALFDREAEHERLGHLIEGDWLPSTPVEVAVALRLAANHCNWESNRVDELKQRVDVMQQLLEGLVTAVLTPERRTEELLADILQLKAITHIWADSRSRQAQELYGMRLRTKALNELWERDYRSGGPPRGTYNDELRSGNWPVAREDDDA